MADVIFKKGTKTNIDTVAKAEGQILVATTDTAAEMFVDITGSSRKKITDTDKVDKVDGKGLSTNDFTNAYKTKLDGIAIDTTYDKDINPKSANAQSGLAVAAAIAAAQLNESDVDLSPYLQKTELKTINGESLIANGNDKDISITGGGNNAAFWRSNTHYLVGDTVLYEMPMNIGVEGAKNIVKKVVCKTEHTSGTTYNGSYWTPSDIMPNAATQAYQDGNGNLITDTYALKKDLQNKQDTLVSGITIKTINNISILGDGNIDIAGGEGSSSGVGQTVNNNGEIFNLYSSTTIPIGEVGGINLGDKEVPANTAGDYAHAEGISTAANGKGSHTEGICTIASGEASHAEGAGAIATAISAHAEGRGVMIAVIITREDEKTVKIEINENHIPQFTGLLQSVEKLAFITKELESIKKNAVIWSEGSNPQFYIIKSIQNNTTSCTAILDKEYKSSDEATVIMGGALSYLSHIEGNYCNALDLEASSLNSNEESSHQRQHAEGSRTLATGYAAHAEGEFTVASGNMSHAQGKNTEASAGNSFAGGDSTLASGYNSTALGYGTTASGDNSFAFGYNTIASGKQSFAEGHGTTASHDNTHSEGYGTTASGEASHAEGHNTTAGGYASHAEGYSTSTSGMYTHAEGYGTQANGTATHAEGSETKTSNSYSHAEGRLCEATEYAAHAEGYQTHAIKNQAHAEGTNTTASGTSSHAEGTNTLASGDMSHTEGHNTKARGLKSHAEGAGSEANGDYTHAGGYETIAGYSYQTVIGKHNANKADSLFEIGYGTSSNSNDRKNVFRVTNQGKVYSSGTVVDSDTDDILITKSYLKSYVANNGGGSSIGSNIVAYSDINDIEGTLPNGTVIFIYDNNSGI